MLQRKGHREPDLSAIRWSRLLEHSFPFVTDQLITTNLNLWQNLTTSFVPFFLRVMDPIFALCLRKEPVPILGIPTEKIGFTRDSFEPLVGDVFLESKKMTLAHPFLHDCPKAKCSFPVD